MRLYVIIFCKKYIYFFERNVLQISLNLIRKKTQLLNDKLENAGTIQPPEIKIILSNLLLNLREYFTLKL